MRTLPMKTIITTIVLGTLASSSLALAADNTSNIRSFFGQKQSLHENVPEAVRTALDSCQTEHDGDREAMKTCADAVFEANGIEKPMHRGFGGKHGMMPELSEAVRTALDSCHTEHDGDREAMKTCADVVFEANGIEKPMFNKTNQQ
jgi:peptide subunit release factor 1 (eRF1)